MALAVNCFANYELVKDPKVSNSEYEFEVEAGVTRKFIQIKKLGEGGFGEIFLVREKHTDQEYALKIFNKEELDQNRATLIRESHDIARQQAAFCKQIATIFECYHRKMSNPEKEWYELYLVLEYYPLGSLENDIIKRTQTNNYYPEWTIRRIGIDILEALQCLHSKDIIHRDLSLGNILIAEIEYNTAESAITPARVVVNDFDVVREEGDFKEKTYVGVDIWSLGIMLCELMTLKSWDKLAPNIAYLTKNDMLTTTMHGHLEDVQRYSFALIQSVLLMLQQDPRRRVPTHVLERSLRHTKGSQTVLESELIKLVQENDIDGIEALARLEIPIDWQQGFNEACEIGQVNIVQSMIDYISDVNQGLESASKRGHLSIVQLLLDKGASSYNSSLKLACYNGHQEIATLLLSKGAKNYDEALQAACAGEFIDLVKIMLDLGAKEVNTPFRSACRSGNMDLVKLLISNGANDFKEGFRAACWHHRMPVVEYLIELGVKEYNVGIHTASMFGHLDIVELMIEKGATSFNVPLKNACSKGHLNIAKILVQRATNVEECLASACTAGFRDLVLLMIAHGARNFNQGLALACSAGHPEIVQEMITAGADNLDQGLQIACSIGRREVEKILQDAIN